MVELKKEFAKFRFLCEAPTLEITPALAEEECLICKEPYQNNGWQVGQTVHRPLALPCGHVLSFHCLAMWMLSTNFDNHCPLCRTKMYDPSTARDRLSRALAMSFVPWEVLAITAPNGISRAQKRSLLESIDQSLRGDKTFGTTTENINRAMVVWEKFLHKICKETARPVSRNPVAIPAAIPAAIERHQGIANELFGSWDQISRCFLPISIELACWVSFYGAILFNAVLVRWWIESVGGEYTLIEMVEASTTLFLGYAVGLPVAISRMPLGYKIICTAVVLWLLLRLLHLWAGVNSAGAFLPSFVAFLVRHYGLEEAREFCLRDYGIIF